MRDRNAASSHEEKACLSGIYRIQKLLLVANDDQICCASLFSCGRRLGGAAASPFALREQRGLCQVRDEAARAGAPEGRAAGVCADDLAREHVAISVEDEYCDDGFLDRRGGRRRITRCRMYKSSWDANWTRNYGGFDNPDSSRVATTSRSRFVPRQNPFYCALPYNDVTHGQFKPEAPLVIPWFKQAYAEPGHSVCKDRWLAIRKGNRTCYAQWEDCGPFRTDHFQYVFQNERPKPNLNRGAGLDVSPAVRDYLGLVAYGRDRLAVCRSARCAAGPLAQLRGQQQFRHRDAAERTASRCRKRRTRRRSNADDYSLEPSRALRPARVSFSFSAFSTSGS